MVLPAADQSRFNIIVEYHIFDLDLRTKDNVDKGQQTIAHNKIRPTTNVRSIEFTYNLRPPSAGKVSSIQQNNAASPSRE